MSCHDCNTTNNCPEEVECGCKMELDSLCVRFNNVNGLPTLGINSGTRLEDILIAIDNFLNTLNTSIINIEARLDELEAGHLTVQEEGTEVLAVTSIMNFIGTYVTVTASGTDTVNVDFTALDTAISDIISDVSTNTSNISTNTSNISTNTSNITTINNEGVLQVQEDDSNVGTTTKTLNFEGSAITSTLDEGSNKTTVTIDSTPGVYSDRAFGGRMLSFGQINAIWFNSQVSNGDGIAGYDAAGITDLQLSVESFIVEAVEQVGVPTVITLDCTSTDTKIIGRLSSTYGYAPFIGNATALAAYTPGGTLDDIHLCTFTEWLKHLNDLTNSHGIHIGDDENIDRIYFEDKDWSITIKREMTPNVLYVATDEADYWYRYTYTSSTKAILGEKSTDGISWSGLSYMDDFTYEYKKII